MTRLYGVSNNAQFTLLLMHENLIACTQMRKLGFCVFSRQLFIYAEPLRTHCLYAKSCVPLLTRKNPFAYKNGKNSMAITLRNILRVSKYKEK